MSMGFYRERRLLTSAGKDIKNRKEILAVLEAIWLPQRVAIVYCRELQRDFPEGKRDS